MRVVRFVRVRLGLFTMDEIRRCQEGFGDEVCRRWGYGWWGGECLSSMEKVKLRGTESGEVIRAFVRCANV